jgi:hypothetical protein
MALVETLPAEGPRRFGAIRAQIAFSPTYFAGRI